MTLNCRSIKKKVANLQVLIEDNKIDVAVLQETWLSQGCASVYSELKELDFNIAKLERKNKRGGGLAILVRKSLSKTISIDYNDDNEGFESISCSFMIGKEKINITNLYRPPSNSKSEFLKQFDSFLPTILERDGRAIICGDFNIDLTVDDRTATELVKNLEIYNLEQRVTKPTRETSLLDYIIIQKGDIESSEILYPLSDFPSDHKPVILQIKCGNHLESQCTIEKTVRDLRKLNKSTFEEDLRKSPLTNITSIGHLSTYEYVELYNSTISELVESQCPLKSRRFRRTSQKWYTKKLQTLKQLKRRAERRYRKSCSQTDLDLYKQAKHNYTVGLRTSRVEYYALEMEKNKSDPKGLYKVINELTGYKKERILPSNGPDETIAEEMSQYFIDKVSNIRKNLTASQSCVDNIKLSLPDIQDDHLKTVNSLTCFRNISLLELKAHISGLKKKSCKLDPIHTPLLMEFAHLINPFILQLVNSSISYGVFPNQLKRAVITPIIKSPSANNNELKNYRPVSSLPFMSKVVEKSIYSQLNEHIEQNHLHAKFQSAYRRNHSCETGLANIFNDIERCLNSGENVVLLLLDSSAAFDTVDHVILVRKLETEYGIKDKALGLIQSYLEQRYFTTQINETEGSPRSLDHGVPQGSLLGPLFYALYTRDIEKIVLGHGFMLHIYADDIQIYCAFKDDEIDVMKCKVQRCLQDIESWMRGHFLKLNAGKTCIKVFGSKFSTTKIDEILNIRPASSVKVLGVTIEDKLNLHKFISQKVQTCNYHIRNLYNIKSCLDFKTKVLLVTNLIMSTLDYCNILFVGSTDKLIRPLHLILNKAVRFIYNLRIREHISPYYTKLHFLPVKKRIKFKACLFAFKILNNQAPTYLTEEFQRFTPSTLMELRKGGGGRDDRMFDISTEDNRKRILFVRIKMEWNTLPFNIRKCNSLPLFKTKLKTHLFTND